MSTRKPVGAIGAPSRRAALLLAVLAGAAMPAAAQGTVSGRIAITERPGERTTDIANTVIYLVPAEGASADVKAADQSIAMQERTFTPRVRVVTPGSRVDFPNQDPFSHNIFSTTRGAVFDLGLYPSGKSKGYTFRRAGVYPVYCNIHPRMTAFVAVVPSPWFALADAEGRFVIERVPAGRYQLHVWHERAKEVAEPIEVAAGGRPFTDVTLDARGFRFEQHRNKFGREYDKTGRDRY